MTSPRSEESWWKRFRKDRADGFKINYDRLLPYASGFTGERCIHENRAIRSIRTVTTMDMPKNVQPGLNPTDGRQQFPAPVAAISSAWPIKHSVRRTVRDEDIRAFRNSRINTCAVHGATAPECATV